MATGGSFPRSETVDHSPESNAEIMNAWSYTSPSPYVFMTWSLVKHRTLLRWVVLS